MNLKEYKFKKFLGQNFLSDTNVVKKIVSSIDIQGKSLAIEIGCGSGFLTKELCEKFDYVIGYEIDKDLEKYLSETLINYKNYIIKFEDFLEANLKQDIEPIKYDNIYIVANIPYYITTPIIEKIINSKIMTNNIILMMQKEVGERFTAKTDSREYNSLTVYLNYYYEIKKLFIVGRDCFIPKPNVDSIIISLKEKKEKLFLKNEDIFFKLVRDSFKYKRKTLRNNLLNYDLEKINIILAKYNLNDTVRAEKLKLEIFVDIANSLSI